MRAFLVFFAVISGLALTAPVMPMASAQEDVGDTYDPFADYSEFEESAEEEADINFFRNGRFFTLGFMGGYRMFTDTMGEIQKPAPSFGFFLSYFFDLRFALQLSFLTGDHKLSFSAPNGSPVSGNVGITNIGINVKYYLNTQNITKGLAQYNPYILGGFSQVYRTTSVVGQSAFGKEGATGFDIGGGIEIPLMRSMYFGGQLAYQLVSFPNENSEIILEGPTPTGIFPTGDVVTLMMILGVNF